MEVGPTGGAGHAHAAAQQKPATPAPAALEAKENPIAEVKNTQATSSINPNAGQNINLIA